jgi:hypothetical protein
MEKKSMSQVAPTSERDRLVKHYKNVVFYMTFGAYAMSHFTRKCYTNLKVGQIRVSSS